MLIQCPECELQVSDKALSCPHCGYPLVPNITVHKARSKTNKHRRLPNGFGQISEIKNRNLRKPFRAMVSVGKKPDGRPICRPLKPESYFATYNDAYAALVEYNKNPYDLESSITVGELYERWTAEHFDSLKPGTIKGIKGAWKHCSAVADMRVVDLRGRHIKGCMEEGRAIIDGESRTPSASTKNKIKSLFNQMLDYAVEYELVDRNYSRTFNLTEETIKEINHTKNEHIPFTDEEMELLWKNVDTKRLVDVILIQCYTGWRPQEIGLIELKDVDLDNGTITGGIKTEAGTNRVVPIHSRIQHLIERHYKEAKKLGSKYLFNYLTPNGKRKYEILTYGRYRKAFVMVCDELKLNPEHKPHDGRKHFVTMAKKYGVDEYAIKYIVGHRISDLTERVYTHRELDWLKSEIEKIK